VIAVLAQQMVSCALELETRVSDNVVNFGRREEYEAVEESAAKCPTRRELSWAGVVYTCSVGFVVAAIGVFTIAKDDAAVEERGAKDPEDAG